MYYPDLHFYTVTIKCNEKINVVMQKTNYLKVLILLVFQRMLIFSV